MSGFVTRTHQPTIQQLVEFWVSQYKIPENETVISLDWVAGVNRNGEHVVHIMHSMRVDPPAG